MILHIPHASTVIPKEYRSLINLTDEELAAEHRYMCDMYTDELFDYRCEKVIAPVSRLICDMERFENDDDEDLKCECEGRKDLRCSTMRYCKEEEEKNYEEDS